MDSIDVNVAQNHDAPPSATRRAFQWGRQAAPSVLVLLPLLLSAAVYLPIVGSYFWGDDFIHLWEMQDGGLARFLVKRHGGHIYLLRNLVFFITYQLAGFDPRPFFAGVLAIHLLNVGLLFLLLRELEVGRAVALFGAALWGILPVHEGTLGWYSAFGQVLCTAALLWFLRELARAARRPGPPTWARTIAWGAVLLAGATCHGAGLAVALVAPVVAYLILPRSAGRARAVTALCALPVATALLYVGCTWLDARLAGGSGRLDFWPANLWRVAPLIGEAWIRLLANAIASVLLPYLCVGLPGWWPCGAIAGAFAGAVLIALACAPGRARHQLAAWLVLLFAVYGAIAAVRAPIAWYFQLTLPQLAAGARFHYLGCLLVVLILSGLLALGRGVRGRTARLGPLLLSAWIAVVMVAWYRAPGIDRHAQARNETTADLARIRARIDGAPVGSEVYIDNANIAGFDRRIFVGSVGLFVITEPGNIVRGRHVYFVESDPAVLGIYRAFPERRTASLLVGPDERSHR